VPADTAIAETSYVTIDERTARRLAPAQAAIEYDRLLAAMPSRESLGEKRHAYLRRVERDLATRFSTMLMIERNKRYVGAVFAVANKDGTADVTRAICTVRESKVDGVLNLTAHALARMMERLRCASAVQALRHELHRQPALAHAILRLASTTDPVLDFRLGTASGQFRGSALIDAAPTAQTWLPNRLILKSEVLAPGQLEMNSAPNTFI
jgi:hypothetical protein